MTGLVDEGCGASSRLGPFKASEFRSRSHEAIFFDGFVPFFVGDFSATTGVIRTGFSVLTTFRLDPSSRSALRIAGELAP